MEASEANQNHHEDEAEEVGHRAHVQDENVGVWVIKELSVDFPVSSVHYEGAEHAVEDRVEEIFVIVVANTVVQPRAMMVHHQDTGVADRAMMAPIWLALQTPDTDTCNTIIFLLKSLFKNRK